MIQNLFDSLLHILDLLIPSVSGNSVLLYLSALGISTAFVFLIREIVAWYWKVNKIILLLEKIANNTSDTNDILRYNSKQNTHTDLVRKDASKDKASFF